MKQGLSLTQLAQELERRAGAKHDVVADTRSIALAVKPHNSEEVGPNLTMRVGDTAHEVNEIAHSQIASRLDIPAKYYNRMLAKSPELLANNVNHWLDKNPERRLVRMLDGKVRAFLSDRYARLENEQLANTVLPILMEDPTVQIVSCEITEARMYIKAVFPKIQGEVVKGDVVQAGISISNSEVGQGSVKIEPLIYRLVCSNGMIINDARFSARHVGSRIGDDANLISVLSEEAIRADDNAVLLKTRDVVRASFDEVRFQRHLTQMVDATMDRLEGNPAEAVKVLAKKESLTEFESGSILRHLIEGADVTRWGLLNAVTRTAQDVSSYDRATDLETLGGNLLNLDRKEWNTYAMAA